MNYRRLGRTGLQVSVVGFGTCQLRLVPERQAVAALRRGFDLGVNLVHTAPDYEGAEELVVRALAERSSTHEVHVCSQSWGTAGQVERHFEETCARLGTARLALFGVASLYDRMMLGENVWGSGGVVEFLLRKKEEGRLGGMFCTTHGPPRHLIDVIERDVFDAFMLAYNPLGFHLLSFNPRNLWSLAGPAGDLPEPWEFEDLPQMRTGVFPLLRARDIGLLVMKPLAGGLLCRGKAFPPRAGAPAEMPGLSATGILRAILADPAVSSVVPGTASVAEAEENALAGAGDLALSPDASRLVGERVRALTRSLCSRCGSCDDRCSRRLPVSWLFRAAYIALYPSETFETFDAMEYFTLHPWKECACLACTDVSCTCPQGIDIPGSLHRLHLRMISLAAQGLVSPPPAGDPAPRPSPPASARIVSCEAPRRLRRGDAGVVRLCVCNTGSRGWPAQTADGRGMVTLAVFVDGTLRQAERLRTDVFPGEKAHFTFEIAAPLERGEHRLRLELVEQHVAFFAEHGVPPLELTFGVD